MIVNTAKSVTLSNLVIDEDFKNWSHKSIIYLDTITANKIKPQDTTNTGKFDIYAVQNGIGYIVAKASNSATKVAFDMYFPRLQGDFDCNGYYLSDFAVDAGETVAAQATVEHTNNSDTYLIMAAIKMRRKMRVNVSVDLRTDTLGQTAYVALYKDGNIIAGTEQTTTEISYITLTWSGIEIADGSELQCAIHASGTGDIVYQRNFAVKVLDYADCYVSVQ